MSQYLNSTLTSKETILYESRISFWSQFPTILLGFATLPAFGLGFILFWVVFMRWKTTRIGITNRRIVSTFGIFARSILELNIRKVDRVEVIQTIPGRILNYGSLVFYGAGSKQAPVPNIKMPKEFIARFNQIKDSMS